MERFRWQRSKLVVQHRAFPRLGAFISALPLISPINQLHKSKKGLKDQQPDTS
jgi:hypothetical protein